MSATVKATIKSGYRIQEETGTLFPQRCNQSGEWEYYTAIQYGRKYNKSFKTKSGATNFLDIEWWKDTSSAKQDELLAVSGQPQVSDQILKLLGLRRKTW